MSLVYFFCLLYNLYYLLLIFQEAHYHFSGFYLIIKRIFSKIFNVLYLVPLLNIFIDSLVLKIISVTSLGVYVIFRLKEKYVVKLKFTKRIFRLISINIIIYLSLFLLCDKYHWHKELIIAFEYVIFFISHIILYPIEIIINKYYSRKAKKKIEKINPIVIGITGSAGKTSCKNILSHLLSGRYVTFMTPKSYNTSSGIAKCINEDMLNATEIAVIEFGASHKNDIKKSLKIVKPSISLITNISSQHLETFKSKENIVKEKTLLMNNSNVHFYNRESTYALKDMKCISFGIGEGADYYINNLEFEKNQSKFDFVEGKTITRFETTLLGKNNLINICACISICRFIGLDYEYLKRKVKTLKPVSSRLEIIHKGDKIIINDSFNSNKNGFLEALNVLCLYDEERVVITPGVVTGGKEIKDINEEIAYKIISYKLKCYLVTSIATGFLKDIFDKENYSYFEVKTFGEAFSLVINDSKVKTILIENDITDIYGR